ncbi:MAG TPA: hypothetical protein VM621_05910 [Luteibacter sp.]|uniref:hypothetical protein n=1 Tax=Luteibacter sp. TaxID=1886636 RepID=UPI002B8F185F|nr:hypothetical protein [Luteibacter sp.]HVI54572.1 hypothetical protein [Luteibacter sp.]
MKNPCPAAVCLACTLLASAQFARAETGRIDFAGSIAEPGCPLRDGAFDCGPERYATAVVEALDLASAQRRIPVELFAYALQRDRSAGWQVLDVTYR